MSGFVQKVNESNHQFNTYGLIFGVVLYNLYILVDLGLVPEIIWLDLVVRLIIVTPILFLYFPVRYYAIGLRSDAVAHEVLHGLGCMLVVASIMFIYANARTSSASEYYIGIVTVVIYMNTIHRKPFPLAVMGTVGCMIVFIVGMRYVTVTSEVAKLPAIMCSVGISVVSLFAAYRIEQVERRDYLASLREKMLLQQIQSANQELQQLSNTDQLTGIRNRRSFDEAASEASAGSGRPRALILLDVDYFKNYNDSEGHIAGDDCLRRIAGRLRSALRRDDGDRSFVARYGGEEFVVLLDDCVTSAALAIGERLRLAVIDEAIPHLNRPDGREIVTVSLGIAVSGDGGEVIYDMVNRADTALYEAKRQGRDRLVLASGPTEAIAGPTGPYDAEAAMSA
ncbi:GGDEF domain-containing protein [Agrobacterium tumefaciens]|uniref:GGDEF domain-containing protein n=1 Tax=Agrobacterium tumefaciens TaxID=358 RepID=UPI00080FEEEF|nr:GGDEF domain-containing protein [Agrobacterium tumefaciens]NSY95165.1 GGDEF domain-containing protein [Agrobacterium tumefaciens]NSZ01652.1 GGDEF domain-containing protein [Agrobacterium tumefaciens]NSZ38962.1 GGDEF domain-containing protein [Agrobacterium tumefaciens]NTB01757.1 GGDEF domain-containing protein [Agrobacterium tumefaciens]NTB23176.1 GGDEF domain-containing protein [Agrobacterium tumefaciens]